MSVKLIRRLHIYSTSLYLPLNKDLYRINKTPFIKGATINKIWEIAFEHEISLFICNKSVLLTMVLTNRVKTNIMADTVTIVPHAVTSSGGIDSIEY